ncbi:MAG: hypothetical protein AABZ08_11570 [Planctomycetota bacterium]
MPRTLRATIALTLATTPCFGGLIAVTPTTPGNRQLEESLHAGSPSITIEATAIVQTLGRIQDSWNPVSTSKLVPVPSINSLNLHRHDQTGATDEWVGNPLHQLRPTATPHRANPTGTISQNQSRHGAGTPKKSEPAFPLAAERTVPEPIMFAFVALMAPVIRPRHTARRVRHLA